MGRSHSLGWATVWFLLFLSCNDSLTGVAAVTSSDNATDGVVQDTVRKNDNPWTVRLGKSQNVLIGKKDVTATYLFRPMPILLTVLAILSYLVYLQQTSSPPDLIWFNKLPFAMRKWPEWHGVKLRSYYFGDTGSPVITEPVLRQVVSLHLINQNITYAKQDLDKLLTLVPIEARFVHRKVVEFLMTRDPSSRGVNEELRTVKTRAFPQLLKAVHPIFERRFHHKCSTGPEILNVVGICLKMTGVKENDQVSKEHLLKLSPISNKLAKMAEKARSYAARQDIGRTVDDFIQWACNEKNDFGFSDDSTSQDRPLLKAIWNSQSHRTVVGDFKDLSDDLMCQVEYMEVVQKLVGSTRLTNKESYYRRSNKFYSLFETMDYSRRINKIGQEEKDEMLNAVIICIAMFGGLVLCVAVFGLSQPAPEWTNSKKATSDSCDPRTFKLDYPSFHKRPEDPWSVIISYSLADPCQLDFVRSMDVMMVTISLDRDSNGNVVRTIARTDEKKSWYRPWFHNHAVPYRMDRDGVHFGRVIPVVPATRLMEVWIRATLTAPQGQHKEIFAIHVDSPSINIDTFPVPQT